MPIYRRASRVQRALSFRIAVMSPEEFVRFCSDLRIHFQVEGYKKSEPT